MSLFQAAFKPNEVPLSILYNRLKYSFRRKYTGKYISEQFNILEVLNYSEFIAFVLIPYLSKALTALETNPILLICFKASSEVALYFSSSSILSHTCGFSQYLKKINSAIARNML